MRLKVTYRRQTGDATDVVVTTDATATVSDVAEELWATDPVTRDTPPPEAGLTLAVTPPGSADHVVLPHERAIGETRVASGFSVQTVRRTTRAGAGAGQAAVVRVTAGADRGREFHLPHGSSTVGRDPGCTIALSDRFVSRVHARIDVGEIIEVIDLDSANGLEVGGETLRRWAVQAGQDVVLGDTRLSIIPLSRSISLEAVVGAFQNASIPFNRSPRVEARFDAAEHRAPKIPREVDALPLPWLGMLVPVLMGAVMYAVTRSPLAILFVAMMPLMLMASHAMQVQTQRRRARAERERFDGHLHRLDTKLDELLSTEQRVRLAEAPSVMEVYRHAMSGGALTWTRRPEHWNFLHLRLGLATQESRNVVTGHDEAAEGVVECVELVDDLVERHRRVPGVPLVESLRTCGSLGLVGSSTALGDLSRGLVVQLAGLYSPSELVLAAIAPTSRSRELEWLKWLPHASSPHSPITSAHLADTTVGADELVAEIDALIDSRREASRPQAGFGALGTDDAAVTAGGHVEDAGAAPPPLPVVVLVVVEGAHLDRARLVRVAEQGATYGVHVLWIAERVESLPAACRTVVDVNQGLGSAQAHLVRLGEVVADLVVEGVSETHAVDFARRLSAMIDAGALVEDASDLPSNVPLGSLLAAECDDPGAVVERWQQNESIRGAAAERRTAGPKRRATLRALVGKSGADSLHLDLRTHGPHALVGGTTGSGKSEFLQSWVLGMAAEYSPERVTFLFVDYKGGAAFGDCVALPHCVGLVTDLSPHLVRRALTSLRAELHHRELLFNTRKVKDLIEFEELDDPECPPALVIVIDEFAALATEVPEFVDGVVDVAQRGRSLGIHLIMATQRPAGVIKDNLRANTNLRIALRMADESDSRDVLETPAAAHFDPATPGRGMAKTGPGRLIAFQSAYAGGRTRTGASSATIAVHELTFGAEQEWRRRRAEEVRADEGPTDLARLVRSVSEAARSAGIEPPRRPWQPELGRTYDLKLLQPRSDHELVYAVADVPASQTQVPVFFRPDEDGNMAVVGTGGSGKSTVLRTLAAAAAVTRRGGPCDVYGLDFGSRGLAMLEDLPHVGAVIPGSDGERVERLLRWLRDEVDERSVRYAAVKAADITEYRRLADRPDERRLLVLLDGLAAFRTEYELSARSAYFTMLSQVAADGRAVGVHFVFTADRPGVIPTSLGATIQQRLTLRLADPQDYGVYGVPGDVIGTDSPPGRGVLEDREVQVAVLGASSSLPTQASAMSSLAAALERRDRAPARPIGRLTDRIALSDLPADGPSVVVGVGDEELLPFSIEPRGAFLVVGPPRSGRTSTLASLVLAVRRTHGDCPMFLFAAKRSALLNVLPWTRTASTEEDQVALASELQGRVAGGDLTPSARRPVVIVVEAVPSLAGSMVEGAVDGLVKAALDADAFVVGEAEVSALGQSYQLGGTLKSGRRGIALQPDDMDGGTVFRTPFPRIARAEFPPGRGLVVESGRASRVQMAMPD